MEQKENSKFGWGVLGFFIPIVGLILFIIWMNKNKSASKAAGIGALIGGIIQIILFIVLVVIGFGLLGQDLANESKLGTYMMFTANDYKLDTSSVNEDDMSLTEYSSFRREVTDASIENSNRLQEYTLESLYPYMKEAYKGEPKTLEEIDNYMKSCVGYLEKGMPYIDCKNYTSLNYSAEKLVYQKANEKPLITIEDILKKLNIEVKKTEDCTGKVDKGEGKYEYIISKPTSTEFSKCRSVTYKINDEFAYKIVYDSEEAGAYINDKKLGTDVYFDFNSGLYANGKTLVTATMHQTTVNGGMSVTLISADGEIYNFKANPEGKGRDINLLDTEGRRDDSYKVNDAGDLIVYGVIFNQLIDDDLLGDYTPEEVLCAKTVEEVASAYGSTPDGAYTTEYTYKLNDNGLYDFNYSSKKTAETMQERYNSSCQ